MKISEITSKDVAIYIHLDEASDETLSLIDIIIQSVKVYMSEYTGIPLEAENGESLDDYEDMWAAAMVLCQDMYDNRALYVEKSNVNFLVSSILDMHCKNLL